MRAEHAVGITLSLICSATLITSLEQLARFRELAIFLTPIDEGRDFRYERVVKALLVARVVLAPAVIFSVLFLDSAAGALTLLALTSLSMRFIWPVGGSGADQLQLITVVSASLCYLLLEPASAAHWAALYISFQLILSYITTGWSKLSSPVWRKGDVLSKIFSTYSYGHPQMGAMLARNTRLNQVATWGPMILFSLTPFFFIQPTTGLLALFLALAFAFHLGTGLFMGLNNFAITFPATYPCVVYAHAYFQSQLQEILRWQ
jgi:hypothetical protein